MSPRREFTRVVKVEIIRRATRDGQAYCEGCGLATNRYDIDHTIPDGLAVDKSKPLTAEDGKLLCSGSPDSCHGRKTATVDVPTIAKAKRVEAKHVRAGGKTTVLSGPDYQTKRAIKEAQSKARIAPGKPAVPAVRPMFVEGR